jgi:hypothetical protein
MSKPPEDASSVAKSLAQPVRDETGASALGARNAPPERQSPAHPCVAVRWADDDAQRAVRERIAALRVLAGGAA